MPSYKFGVGVTIEAAYHLLPEEGETIEELEARAREAGYEVVGVSEDGAGRLGVEVRGE